MNISCFSNMNRIWSITTISVSRNVIIKNIIFIFSYITVLFFASFNSSANTCEDYEEWASISLENDKDLRINQYVPLSVNGKSQATQLLFGLRDENLKPLFGNSLDQLDHTLIETIKQIPNQCLYGTRLEHLQQLRNQCMLSRDRNSSVCKQSAMRDQANSKLSNFVQSMLGVARPERDPAFIEKVIQHQKYVYQERKKAIELMHQNPISGEFFSNDIDGLIALETLSNNPLLSFIDREEQVEYRNQIKNHLVVIMDGILDGKMNGYASAAKEKPDLRKLKEVIDDYVNTKNEMAKYLSTKWAAYDESYKKYLDAYALRALENFTQYLSSLPIESDSVNLAYEYLNELFAYQPRPASFSEYTSAISNYADELAVKLEVKRCNEIIEKSGIGKNKTIPLLGPRGSMSMGDFVCALSKSRYGFIELVEPGFFSSEYLLELTNERGISVSITMVEKEAIKGSPTLVGIKVADAASERDLTIDGWQRLIETMLW